MQKANLGPAPTLISEGEAAPIEEAGDGSEPTGEIVEPLVLPRGGRGLGGPLGAADTSVKRGMSQWDMLWLALAALGAYVIGKGRDQPASDDQEADAGESEADAAADQPE